MLDVVDIGHRSLESYRGVAPDEQLDELVRVARRLRGARILHLNAISYGGGVSEILRFCVPLLKALGLEAEWKIIRGDDAFFQITKRLHNGLQGAPGELSESEKALYLGNAQLNAPHLAEDYDFVIVHDPQPAAIPGLVHQRGSKWIWRCHIDTSHPNPTIWDFLMPYLGAYDAAVFTLENFIPPRFPIRRVAILPPAIDPLSPKNLALPQELARHILEWIGVRLSSPLVTQVSRFDKWKDPLGVVAAYRRVRQHLPDVQLALECADALLHLLRHPQVAHALGESGRERVRHHFLMPRLLLDELRLLEALTEEKGASTTPAPPCSPGDFVAPEEVHGRTDALQADDTPGSGA